MNTPASEAAQAFGRFFAEGAARAGYDLTSGAGGRKRLAKDVGMSPSAISRTIEGVTLPRPSQMEKIARVLKMDLRTTLVQGKVISGEYWTDENEPPVRSASLTPEDAADEWGITDPMIRKMLISNVEQAIRLQQEAEAEAEGGGAASRG
ncbi:helix-turn-helix transcriptional regulator [Streptomyces sp. ITFR-6]|uniref:helix-turn-helix domain-containing protein n=1 Tax=Streptomyces sp. ITFR-6 TaxID=3075197 RepID=UPI002889E74E|nr:helix-turn-helix transcriptional regulator [Streptomyces sp. ITFR-6]WNI31447.1 helix-turn-helix transcriptional regulator [Streptomyces sp. ITFR-6]